MKQLATPLPSHGDYVGYRKSTGITSNVPMSVVDLRFTGISPNPTDEILLHHEISLRKKKFKNSVAVWLGVEYGGRVRKRMTD